MDISKKDSFNMKDEIQTSAQSTKITKPEIMRTVDVNITERVTSIVHDEIQPTASLANTKDFEMAQLQTVDALPKPHNLLVSNPEESTAANDTTVTMVEGGPKYPTGIRFMMLTISLMLVTFMVALDTTIISTAIPSITTQFRSIADIGWYTGAYLLPLMALQPTFGKIYTYFSIKIVTLVSICMFEVGSLICALSPSSSVFILGRGISAIGAAGIFGGGNTIIQLTVPLSRVSVYLSILSSMYGVAGLTGPPLGGLFTSSAKLTWRFCFYINLPFGGMAALLMLFTFREPKRESLKLTPQEKLQRMDFGGTILFISSIVCLFLALQRGGNDVSWSDSKAWGMLLGFGLALIAFIALQIYMGDNATIPPRVLRNRSVVLAVVISILMSLGTNTHTFYLPFYFQSAKSLSASASGIKLLPSLISVTLTELVVGTGVSWLGVYVPFMIFGTGIYIAGASLLCTIQLDTSAARLIGYQILAGVGFGSSLQLCATVIRANVEEEDIPVAGSLSIFGSFLGGTLAAGIGQNIFRSTLLQQLLVFVSPAEAVAIVEAGARGGVDVVSNNLRSAVLLSYSFAVRKTFMISAVAGGIAFLCSLGLKWKNIKKSV